MPRKMNIGPLSSADVQGAGRKEPADVSGAVFDTGIPRTQREAQILRLTGDPYCFRVGELRVKLEFPDGAPPLQEVFSGFLRRKKNGI